MATMTDTLTTRILAILNDPNQYVYSDAVIEAALSFALSEYSAYCPRLEVENVAFSEDGNELDLSSLTNIRSIRKLYYPWDSGKSYAGQEVNAIMRWDFEIISGSAKGTLDIKDNVIPQVGDEARVIYTTEHTIEGLNAATVTTVESIYLDLIVKGAVGYAMLYTTSNRTDLLNKEITERLANFYLKSFRDMLNAVTNEDQRNQAITLWDEMDKYERVY